MILSLMLFICYKDVDVNISLVITYSYNMIRDQNSKRLRFFYPIDLYLYNDGGEQLE